ncbi:MAG: transcriptional antiterminator, Rof [Halobacteria archaeon]|nr:transcriptional antiterminator, Rof [Halobacteria archaeon]
MSDYTPVDCGLHSAYELAIMQRRRLALSWHGEQAEYRDTVTPVDLFTRDVGEYLRVRDSRDLGHSIRLDRIMACEFL